MAARFVNTSESTIHLLKTKAENENTQKSTASWLSVWQEWALCRNYHVKMENYPPEELNKTLEKFYAEVRTKTGDEYEPESLKVMQAALDRYLREKKYPYSIIRDDKFEESKKVLEGKARELRKEGRGKRPNAAKPLTLQEEEMLWQEGKLGNSSPQILTNTMWWLLTQHFGLRGRQEHHTMAVEDFSFGEDDNGHEYITFHESPTKTRQGGLHITRRQQLPKMFATGGERCPVELFREYINHRPHEIRYEGPFYLTPLPKKTQHDIVWYKRVKLGVNSIAKIMKLLIANTSLEDSGKKLTNHSARKTLVKKLRASNVERSSIMNVTGHRNEQSLNDYDEGNEVEQRHISNLISNANAGQCRQIETMSSPQQMPTQSFNYPHRGFQLNKQFIESIRSEQPILQL